MKAKVFMIGLLIASLLVLTTGSLAQAITFEWTRWDDVITVQPATSTLDIAETQEFQINSGTVRRGSRSWTDPVDIQGVFYVSDGQPVPLTAGQGEDPGTYTLSDQDGETFLTYYLPQVAEAGESFIVQINYTTPIPNEGLVDWIVIPGDHGATVNSSTVTVNFPEGDVPDEGLVRVVSGNGTVNVQGNTVVIQSNTPIASDQSFALQMPFGEGVGAASDPVGNQPAANEPAPADNVGAQAEPAAALGIDFSTILLILCVIGALVIFGGGGLLRSLLGAFLGGGLGGISGQPRGGGFFPTPRSGGTTRRRVNPPPSGSGSSRGFRPSSRQGRSAPTIRSDKDDGGSAGLG